MMTMATSLSFVPIASGLRINEVELNPPLDDSGNEWAEIYSESEINLEGYYFYIDEIESSWRDMALNYIFDKSQ